MTWEPKITREELDRVLQIVKELGDSGHISIWDILVVKRVFGMAFFGPEEWRKEIHRPEVNPEHISGPLERILGNIRKEETKKDLTKAPE